MGFFFIYTLSLTFLFMILFLWSTQASGPLYTLARLAGRFDRKLTVANGLSRLTDCLYKASPGKHNATLADFTRCLSAMGLA